MLQNHHIERLKKGLRACYAIPFIDDVEDFIFEALFHYALGLPVPNQIDGEKTKLLYDAVEPATGRGWSLKTHMTTQQAPFEPGKEFELVVQRADVFDKAEQLGFPGLGRESPPGALGAAILKHWHRKIDEDCRTQNVKEPRVCVLLKSPDRRNFCLYEDEMHRYRADHIHWVWTNAQKKGLQGVVQATGFIAFRWYPNQKHLFERFTLPRAIHTFTISRRPLKANDVVELVLSVLDR